MKCVCYCRVSTVGQSEDGISLEMQETRAKAWALANDYQVEAIFIEAMSGGKASNRPELQKALALACRTKGVLLVYSLSRLARSVKDTLAIAEQLEKAGANLASITERIDTNSALSKMVFRLLSTLNEFEKDTLIERTESAMAHLRRSNKRISAKIPFGYDLADDNQTLTPNQEEQELIRLILIKSAEGKGVRLIAKVLNETGAKSKNGGTWHPSTVKGTFGIIVTR